jgi:asparagine synthase (glutamine-hydrolysing)
MCGIAGFIDAALSAAERDEVLSRMRVSLRHRGPDDHGQISDGPVGLAMQRLSIVDLKSGHQPMLSEDGSIWLVFNGEIYNHLDLRRVLEIKGRRFRTRSDTEVILAQYEYYGLNGLADLNGMFAFAIWDGTSRELHLVRDRLGVKPLYYYCDGRRFYFASELKALVAAGTLELVPNPQAIWDYLTFRYVPAPMTIWQKTWKLSPAHTLSLEVSNLNPKPRRYWDSPYAMPESRTPSRRSRRELLEEFTYLFLDSVHIRMLADVPVGVFLSGGLDSSSVAAAVQRENFPRLKTFFVGFEDAGDNDEQPSARLVADHLETDHRELYVTAEEYAKFLSILPWQTDEPLADPTCIAVHLLARMARADVKVVLSGEGADEIFGGYTFDVIQKAWDEGAALQRSAQRRHFMKWVLESWRKDCATSRYSDADQRRARVPLHITNYYSSDEKREIWRGDVGLSDSVDVLTRDLRRVHADHPLHQSLYLYSQNWLVEDLLMKADKMTMAASLELRTPFLDYRLVEWAARAPAIVKVDFARGKYVTKATLRGFARGRLPTSIIERPKMGFPVPVYGWLQNRLRPLLYDTLGSTQPMCSRWLEPKAISELLERGTCADATMLDRHKLWNLFILELWSRAWLR